MPSFSLLRRQARLLQFRRRVVLHPHNFFCVIYVIGASFPVVFQVSHFLQQFRSGAFEEQLKVMRTRKTFGRKDLCGIVLLVQVSVRTDPRRFSVRVTSLRSGQVFPILKGLRMPLTLRANSALSISVNMKRETFQVRFSEALVQRNRLRLVSNQGFHRREEIHVLRFVRGEGIPHHGKRSNGRNHHRRSAKPTCKSFEEVCLRAGSPVGFPLAASFREQVGHVLVPGHFRPFNRFLIQGVVRKLLRTLRIFPINLSTWRLEVWFVGWVNRGLLLICDCAGRCQGDAEHFCVFWDVFLFLPLWCTQDFL